MMAKALNAVKVEKMSVRQAANEFDIPRGRLHCKDTY